MDEKPRCMSVTTAAIQITGQSPANTRNRKNFTKKFYHQLMTFQKLYTDY